MVNAGDLYISPLGQGTTAGVPSAMILKAVFAGFNNSTGGFFSIPYGKRFNYTRGNFWVSENKDIVIREFFYQDFNGTGLTANMPYYRVGTYPGASNSYDYEGAAAYTGLTDIGVNIFTRVSSTTDGATLYVEYVMTHEDKSNV